MKVTLVMKGVVQMWMVSFEKKLNKIANLNRKSCKRKKNERKARERQLNKLRIQNQQMQAQQSQTIYAFLKQQAQVLALLLQRQ